MGFTSAPQVKTDGNGLKNTSPQAQKAGLPAAARVKLKEAYGRIPLYFEPNEGQTDPQVRFLARGGGYTLYLTPAEAVFVLKRGEAGKTDPKKRSTHLPIKVSIQQEVLRLRLADGNRQVAFEGLESAEGKSNYYIGRDPDKWRTGVNRYSKVRAKDIYPGIDMVYYGNQGKLEYDFVVAPGADPGLIGFNTQGSQESKIDPQGNLVFRLAQGDVNFKEPTAYQVVEGERKIIGSQYGMGPDGRIGFIIGNYDKTLPLVIDPALDYSNLFGRKWH